ncbi:Protein of unknown function [Azospirillum oryzae]|uniref:DUF2946 domain-containing protein n=1 Tax=Azospirillum oryzae TaxID=286727 RepID=A0A1X7EA08_9PROT|nr:DUF2946 family protein [Azospirillum oryzae]SMF30364.1 Protein of unknown function [Azospirillum oryzae]
MAFGRSTVRRVRRLGLVAGMVALLLQVIAWGWMPMAPGIARAGETASLPICSSDGLTTIQVDATLYGIGEIRLASDDGGPDKSPDHAPSDTGPATGHCPLCPLVAGLALPPPPLMVGPTLAMASDTRLLPGERIAAGWFLSTLQARAPPLLG